MYNYEATIRRWVDGDTVDVDIDLGFGLVYSNQRLRLYGIDAYESRTRNLDEKKKGLAAKDYVNEMAPVGTKVTIITHKTGKYGRILAEIFFETEYNDWKCINNLLVEEGHATEYQK
jgi:micrococcal nuclease